MTHELPFVAFLFVEVMIDSLFACLTFRLFGKIMCKYLLQCTLYLSICLD